MMRMILGFVRRALIHRIIPGHAFAIGTNDRIEIGRQPFLVPPFGEQLPVDLNADAVVEFGQTHFSGR